MKKKVSNILTAFLDTSRVKIENKNEEKPVLVRGTRELDETTKKDSLIQKINKNLKKIGNISILLIMVGYYNHLIMKLILMIWMILLNLKMMIF